MTVPRIALLTSLSLVMTLGGGATLDRGRLFAGEAAASETGFEDLTGRAGVARPHHRRRFYNPYAQVMEGYTAQGASAAVADFDGDGFEDLFVTDSAQDMPNHLYRNNGDLTFTDVALAAGVARGNDAVDASAAGLWLDYDNDGRPDLFVVRFGRSQLFHNIGGGRFEDVTARSGLGGYANAMTAIAFDYDGDGDVDLFVGAYFQPVDLFHPRTPRFFPESFETADNGGGVIVFRNDGGGAFTEVTHRVGIDIHGWTLSLGHADADGDGDEDLYVACDFGQDRFFVNEGDGTFSDRTRSAIGIDTKKGMNADWGDFDGDGRPDVCVTNITDDYMREGNYLWRNNGDLTFTDVARETGVHDTGWGWGARFFDYDNDGWLDLYVTNGWVSAGPESYVPDIFALIVKPDADLADARNWPPMGSKSLSGYQRNCLFRNVEGRRFVNEAARLGVDSIRDGRGVAVADFDNDGRLDMFVANAGAEPCLFHNRLPADRHWMEVLLEGRRSNRGAVGAVARLTAGGRTLVREVDGGNSFAAQSSPRVHFGLAGADRADRLEVKWPSGVVQSFTGIPADRIYRIVEGEGPEPIVPRAARR